MNKLWSALKQILKGVVSVAAMHVAAVWLLVMAKLSYTALGHLLAVIGMEAGAIL